jgi:hypothetical protein
MGNYILDDMRQHLEAIDAVRHELKAAEISGQPERDKVEILKRLFALYSTLNVGNLKSVLQGLGSERKSA